MRGTTAMPEIDQELMQEFLAGSEEHITGAENALIELEKNPGSMELINEIFRHFHSLKGDAASIGIHEIRNLAHEMESLLDELRTGSRGVTPELLDMLLDGLAGLARQVKQVETGQHIAREETLVNRLAETLKAPQDVAVKQTLAAKEHKGHELAIVAPEQLAETGSEERTYIVFRAGSLRCAINVDQSNEIITSTRITPVPNVGKSIQGVINLRGSIIPVINLASRLGIVSQESPDQQILILILDGTKIGLLVEEVYEVRSWSGDRLLRPTSVAFDLKRTFVSDVVVENGLINLILNLAEVTKRDF